VKVCVFTRDFPPERGGVQTSKERIAFLHAPDSIVVTRRSPGDKDFDRDRPYKVIRMPRLEWSHANNFINAGLRALSLFLRFLVGGIMVSEAIREQKSDVVHCAYAFPNGLPMMVVRIFTGCPYVVYCHGTEVTRVIEQGGIRLAVLRLILRLALRVVVTGEFMRGEVAKVVDAKKIVVTPLGADSGTLNPDAAPAEEAAGVSLAGKKVILTVGRIETRKGHDMVVHALPMIFAKEPAALWVVAGDGPDRARIEKLVHERELGAHVVFAGTVFDQQLSALLTRADVFLMPNRRIGADVEGFGIVFLEAALFGVPAVGGRSGGAPDAVLDGETGLLCDPENPDDIAEKVLRILSSPDLARQLGQRAKERARTRTWRQYCEVVDRELVPLID
jgi:phosphatidylinositol alpha-1,6-mannosyltransferase